MALKKQFLLRLDWFVLPRNTICTRWRMYCPEKQRENGENTCFEASQEKWALSSDRRQAILLLEAVRETQREVPSDVTSIYA